MTARRFSRPGFTLVEIMVVVVIIGLLAAVAIPAFNRVQQKSRLSAFLNDLRKIEDAVNLYAQERGSFPPDYDGGIVVPELSPYLTKPNFTISTPLGGFWDWDNHPGYVRISVAPITAANAQLVDTAIDDGNLSTGKVTHDGSALRYYFNQ